MLYISILQIDHLIGCVHHDDVEAKVVPFSKTNEDRLPGPHLWKIITENTDINKIRINTPVPLFKLSIPMDS